MHRNSTYYHIVGYLGILLSQSKDSALSHWSHTACWARRGMRFILHKRFPFLVSRGTLLWLTWNILLSWSTKWPGLIVCHSLGSTTSFGLRRALRTLTYEMLMATTMITRAGWASILYLRIAFPTSRTPSRLGNTSRWALASKARWWTQGYRLL